MSRPQQTSLMPYPTSGPDMFPANYCSRACVSVQIRHCCGRVYNTRFSHLDGVHKLEGSVVKSMTKEETMVIALWFKLVK